MAIFYTDSGSFNDLKVTGSAFISASRGVALQLRSSGSTIFSVSGSSGEIFNISDAGSSTALFTVASSSVNILNVDITKNVSVSGSLLVTGSAYFRDLVTSSTAVTNVVMYGTNGQLFTTASTAIGGGSGTPAFPFNGNAIITGSLVVSGSSSGFSGITGSLFGTASWALTASIANNALKASGLDAGTYNITASWANNATAAGNGGVTSVSIVSDYPLAMEGGSTTGAVQIKTTYTQLTQIFSQADSDPPTVDATLINTTGETYTWGYDVEGIYTLTADNSATPFIQDQTAIQLTAGCTDAPVSLSYEYESTSVIKIYSWSLTGNALRNSILDKATIDIKIFP